MERNKDGAYTLTREELYAQIWTTPIRHIAKEYGISDVGLAKACKKHKIPRPPVGYWAKRRNGKDVKRPRLPTIEDPALQNVRIRPHGGDGYGVLNPDILRDIEAEGRPENVIVVPDEPIDPLPIILRTEKSLRSAKPDEWGRVKPRSKNALFVSVTRSSIERAMRILDTLVKSLKARSFTVSSNGGQAIKAEVHGEAVEFVLTEEVNREERELTTAEKRKQEANPWLYRDPQYRYLPSGRLSLEIDTYGRDGIRRRWTDGKKQRIEAILNSFVVTLLRIADAVHERRRREEEDRRRREEWERQRGEKLRLIREEEERLEHLNAEIDAWHGSQRIRSYISAVREAVTATQGQIEEGSPCDKWLKWATQQADRADPLVKSPPSILDEKSKWEYGY